MNQQLDRRSFLIAAAGLPSLAYSATLWEPSRYVEMLVSYPAGGSADVIGRAVAANIMASKKAWQIVPVNKGGAGGQIFLNALHSAKGDGQTIGVCLSSQLTFRPEGMARAPYEVSDFRLLGSVATSYLTVLAKGDSPITSIEGIKEYARRKGSVSMGVSPTFQWLSTALSKSLDIEVTGVTYKGSGELLPALLGGHVDLVVWAGGTEQYERNSQVRVLGTLGTERIPGSPQVPTFKESGVPVQIETHYMFLAPKTLGDSAAEALTAAIAAAARAPDFQQKMQAILGRPAQYVAPAPLLVALKAQRAAAEEYEAKYGAAR